MRYNQQQTLKNEIPTHAKMWLKLEDLLSEINPLTKGQSMISLT